MVMHWQENHIAAEVPPRNIWHHGGRLEEWFEAVKQNRENRTGSPEADEPEQGMTQNELTKGLRD